jgi:hypothetical protein
LQAPCETQDARQATHSILLVRREVPELSVPGGGLCTAMIANYHGEEIPILGLPPERHRYRSQEVTDRLVRSSSAPTDTNGVKLRGGAKNGPQTVVVADGWDHPGHREPVEEEKREVGNDGGSTGIAIHRARGCAQARSRRGSHRVARRQARTPFAEEAALAAHGLAILFESGATSRGDRVMKRSGRSSLDAIGLLGDPGAEDVQVVDFAEQALDLSEVLVPRGRSLGQQRLNGIAEAFQCDAERVPWGGRNRAHGASV